MRGFGGMVSVRMRGGRSAAEALCANKVFILAESLGGVESLIEHPADDACVDPVHRRFPTIWYGSVGIEDIADLIADLEQALG